MVKIALDAMGGDLGVSAVVGGVAVYLKNCDCSDVVFMLFGKKETIEKKLEEHGILSSGHCSVVEANELVTPDMKPSTAMRLGRGSSMFEAIKSVSLGHADAVVSSGNTGAYMALSILLLKTIDKIERPALVQLFPTVNGGKSVVLDLGANVECSSANLIQFSIIGAAVAKVWLKVDNPSIALLNIGTERCKGTDSLRCSADYLEKDEGINFVGFVEGSDISFGVADVIVTDGFSGNIALKTVEGTIKYLAAIMKKNITESIWGRIAYFLGKGVVNKLRESVDPRNHNGAVLVGLNGIVVKSHGNSDHIGFSNAISVAVEFSKWNLIDGIKNEMKKEG